MNKSKSSTVSTEPIKELTPTQYRTQLLSVLHGDANLIAITVVSGSASLVGAAVFLYTSSSDDVYGPLGGFLAIAGAFLLGMAISSIFDHKVHLVDYEQADERLPEVNKQRRLDEQARIAKLNEATKQDQPS